NGPDSSRVRTVRAVASAVSYETYCFGGGASAGGAAAPSAGLAPAASGAAWPAASAGAAVPAAGGAEESEAAGAGGGFAASGAADSCFAQAVSISAATIALRASLVFIDRYPEGSKSCIDETRPSAVVPAPVPGPRSANSIEVPVRL